MKVAAHPFEEAHALKCELAAEALRSAGTLKLQVTGWSMLPSVWPGDTLVVESVDRQAVSEGDIALFARDRRLFAHRVVANRSGDGRLVTRGDAMPAPDSPISDGELLGKVSRILRNGRWLEPSRRLCFTERAVAALARGSEIGARVVVSIHGIQQAALG
jgi:hypothetical protein